MNKTSPSTKSLQNAPATKSEQIAPWKRLTLPRIPLVPDDVLKQHNAFCSFDSRFRQAARLLQCLWMKDHGIPTSADSDDVNSAHRFASILRADAAKAGRNFLNIEIYQVVLRELLVREEGASFDEERLFKNSLSSQPLTFSLFGNMAENLNLATAVFRHLFPAFVGTVDQIIFEHSPSRDRSDERWLKDGTAWDAAVRVTTPGGEDATIYIETKYSEDMMGPAARLRDRYDEASRQVKLYRDPDSPILRSLALEQLWREHTLAQLTVDQGITSRAMFLAIGPRLNRRVMSAFRAFQCELCDPEHTDAKRVAFEPMSLETFIEAIWTAGAENLAQALWDRYCDFQRVYDVSLAAIGGRIADVAEASRSVPLDGDSLPLNRRDRRILSKRTTRAARNPVEWLLLPNRRLRHDSE
jgi:hypothetical protein